MKHNEVFVSNLTSKQSKKSSISIKLVANAFTSLLRLREHESLLDVKKNPWKRDWIHLIYTQLAYCCSEWINILPTSYPIFSNVALTSKHERDFTEVSCILFTLKKLNIRWPKFTKSSLFHKQIFSAKYELNYPSGYKIQKNKHIYGIEMAKLQSTKKRDHLWPHIFQQEDKHFLKCFWQACQKYECQRHSTIWEKK